MSGTTNDSLVYGLARSYFQGNNIFDLETERIFSRNWICVGRVEEFGDSKDELFRTLNVGHYGIVIIRKRDGAVSAFHNICRHRGTQLFDQPGGRIENSCITCPYHAWRYDLNGCLTDAPTMCNTPGFDRDDHGLMPVGCANWCGFIMINLEKPSEDFENDLEPIIQRMADWELDSQEVGYTLSYDVQANWKLLFQSYSDCLHYPTVQPILNQLTPYETARNDLTEGRILGGPMGLADGVETVSADGKLVGEVFSRLNDRQRRSSYYYTVFPNMFISAHPDYVMVHQIKRVSNERSEIQCQFLAAPGTPSNELARAAVLWDEIYRKDWSVCELTQKGIESPAYDPGPYSKQESMLMAFDRHYRVSMIEPGEAISVATRRPKDIPIVHDPVVTGALLFIREEFGHGIGVAEVAKALDVSQRSLEVKFKQTLGRSPLADLRLVRNANAKRLLANSDQSIAEIAEQCGYGSQQSFSTTFRRQEEMTPIEYRNQFLG